MSNEQESSFNIFSLYDNFIKFNADCVNLVKNVDEENFKNYQDILKKQEDTLSFNIFKVFTKQWKYENFHSESIKFLLEFGQDTLNDFLLFLNEQKTLEEKKLSTQINIENYNNSNLVCEYVINNQRRIDILITGLSSSDAKQHAIIIENKINWAADQENQIYDYYKHINETYIVDCIVYLVPHREKSPSKNSLGVGKKFEKEIKEKLIILPSFSGDTNDLVTSLESSLSNLESKTEQENRNEENYRVFLNNYIDLLKYTGAGDMTVVASKFFEQLFSAKNEKDDTLNKLKESTDSSTESFEKLKFIQEMIPYLVDYRYNLIANNFAGGCRGTPDKQNAWYKPYITKEDNQSYGIDIKFGPIGDYFYNKTTIEIFYEGAQDERQERNKYLKAKILNLPDNRGQGWDINPTSGRLYKEFSFPKENTELIATLKKIEKLIFNPR